MPNDEEQRYIDWIRGGLAVKGKTQYGLADHLGISHPQVSSLLKGNRKLKVNEIPIIAEYLEIPPPARKFPLLGLVGAGGEITMTDWPGEPDMVEGPDDAPFETVCVEIRGGSLGPGFDGWRVFYNDVKEPFHDDWFRHLCVVGTSDGRQLIKWVRKGEEGFNLHSGTGEIEEDVELQWAAKVIDLRPPA